MPQVLGHKFEAMSRAQYWESANVSQAGSKSLQIGSGVGPGKGEGVDEVSVMVMSE